MGLGLYCVCSVPPAKSGKTAASRKLLNDIATALPELIRSELRMFLEIDDSEDLRLLVVLHPSEEPVELFVNEDQQLICSAKTSSCGPGYHAMLVGLLKQLEGKLGTIWHGEESPDETGDETNYWETGSFAALQTDMWNWYQQLIGIVLDDEQLNCVSLSLPIELSPDESCNDGSMAQTCLGTRTRQQLEAIRDCPVDQLDKMARESFAWWNQELDGDFWFNTGAALLWIKVRWHVPLERNDELLYEMVLKCFDNAVQMGRNSDPYAAELDELRALLNGVSVMPSNDGASSALAGYWRRPQRYALNGGWTIRLPGYFYDGTDEADDSTLTFYHDSRVFHATTYSTGDASPDELLQPEEATSTGQEVLDLRQQDPPAYGIIEFVAEGDEEDPEPYWQLVGKTARRGTLCLTSFIFTDVADREWAISAWRSLQHEVLQNDH